MDSVVIGWVGISLVVIGNVAALAFWGGRITMRLNILERLLNEHLHEHRRR